MTDIQAANYRIKATDETAAAFNAVNKRLTDMGLNATVSGTMVVDAGKMVGTAVAAAAAAIGYMTVSSVQALAAQNDLAQTLGTTQAQLVALRRAADLSGVSHETLEKAAKKLNNTIGEGQAGNKAANETFARMGLTADRLAAMPLDERFAAISRSVSGLATQTERAALMQDVFGKSGQDLLPMMQDSGETLRYAAEQTVAWGTALSELDMAQVAEADDRMSDVRTTVDGLQNQLATAFAPTITVVSERLVRAAQSGRGFGDSVFEAFRVVAMGVGYVTDLFSALHLGIKTVEVATNSMALAFNLAAMSVETVALAIDRVLGTDTVENIKQRQKVITGTISAGMKRVADSSKELADIYNAPLPHENVDKFFADVRAQSRKTLDELVANDKKHTDSAAVEVAKRVEIKKGEGSKVVEVATAQRVEMGALSVTWNEKEQAEAAEANKTALDGEVQRNTEWMRSLEDDTKKGWKGKLSAANTGMGQLSSLMQSGRRKEFELGKAAAIGQAIIGTSLGVTEALKAPWFMSPFLVATALLTGGMQVRAIKNTQFGGGGAANVGAVPTMSVGETGLPSRSSQVAEAPMLPASSSSSAPARNVTVIVQSDSGMVSTDWLVNQLGPTLKDAYGDGHFNFLKA